MKSRQSHIPRAKRLNTTAQETLRPTVGTNGRTAWQAQDFASGILGKYGFWRHPYLGLLSLIFKQNGLLEADEATGVPSRDKEWIVKLELQLRSLQHPDNAHVSTNKQTIHRLERLIQQYRSQLMQTPPTTGLQSSRSLASAESDGRIRNSAAGSDRSDTGSRSAVRSAGGNQNDSRNAGAQQGTARSNPASAPHTSGIDRAAMNLSTNASAVPSAGSANASANINAGPDASARASATAGNSPISSQTARRGTASKKDTLSFAQNEMKLTNRRSRSAAADEAGMSELRRKISSDIRQIRNAQLANNSAAPADRQDARPSPQSAASGTDTPDGRSSHAGPSAGAVPDSGQRQAGAPEAPASDSLPGSRSESQASVETRGPASPAGSLSAAEEASSPAAPDAPGQPERAPQQQRSATGGQRKEGVPATPDTADDGGDTVGGDSSGGLQSRAAQLRQPEPEAELAARAAADQQPAARSAAASSAEAGQSASESRQSDEGSRAVSETEEVATDAGPRSASVAAMSRAKGVLRWTRSLPALPQEPFAPRFGRSEEQFHFSNSIERIFRRAQQATDHAPFAIEATIGREAAANSRILTASGTSSFHFYQISKHEGAHLVQRAAAQLAAVLAMPRQARRDGGENGRSQPLQLLNTAASETPLLFFTPLHKKAIEQLSDRQLLSLYQAFDGREALPVGPQALRHAIAHAVSERLTGSALAAQPQPRQLRRPAAVLPAPGTDEARRSRSAEPGQPGLRLLTAPLAAASLRSSAGHPVSHAHVARYVEAFAYAFADQPAVRQLRRLKTPFDRLDDPGQTWSLPSRPFAREAGQLRGNAAAASTDAGSIGRQAQEQARTAESGIVHKANLYLQSRVAESSIAPARRGHTARPQLAETQDRVPASAVAPPLGQGPFSAAAAPLPLTLLRSLMRRHGDAMESAEADGARQLVRPARSGGETGEASRTLRRQDVADRTVHRTERAVIDSSAAAAPASAFPSNGGMMPPLAGRGALALRTAAAPANDIRSSLSAMRISRLTNGEVARIEAAQEAVRPPVRRIHRLMPGDIQREAERQLSAPSPLAQVPAAAAPSPEVSRRTVADTDTAREDVREPADGAAFAAAPSAQLQQAASAAKSLSRDAANSDSVQREPRAEQGQGAAGSLSAEASAALLAVQSPVLQRVLHPLLRPLAESALVAPGAFGPSPAILRSIESATRQEAKQPLQRLVHRLAPSAVQLSPASDDRSGGERTVRGPASAGSAGDARSEGQPAQLSRRAEAVLSAERRASGPSASAAPRSWISTDGAPPLGRQAARLLQRSLAQPSTPPARAFGSDSGSYSGAMAMPTAFRSVDLADRLQRRQGGTPYEPGRQVSAAAGVDGLRSAADPGRAAAPIGGQPASEAKALARRSAANGSGSDSGFGEEGRDVRDKLPLGKLSPVEMTILSVPLQLMLTPRLPFAAPLQHIQPQSWPRDPGAADESVGSTSSRRSTGVQHRLQGAGSERAASAERRQGAAPELGGGSGGGGSAAGAQPAAAVAQRAAAQTAARQALPQLGAWPRRAAERPAERIHRRIAVGPSGPSERGAAAMGVRNWSPSAALAASGPGLTPAAGGRGEASPVYAAAASRLHTAAAAAAFAADAVSRAFATASLSSFSPARAAAAMTTAAAASGSAPLAATPGLLQKQQARQPAHGEAAVGRRSTAATQLAAVPARMTAAFAPMIARATLNRAPEGPAGRASQLAAAPAPMMARATSGTSLEAPAGQASQLAAASARMIAHATSGTSLEAPAGRASQLAAAPAQMMARAASSRLPEQAASPTLQRLTASGRMTAPAAPMALQGARIGQLNQAPAERETHTTLEHKHIISAAAPGAAESASMQVPPLEMDWLQTKRSEDVEMKVVAPAEPMKPQLDMEEIQELMKRLPQMDVNKIADKVYREIEKKMRFEKQRYGK